jgi:geranylgeranyl pyrophosphate synthase
LSTAILRGEEADIESLTNAARQEGAIQSSVNTACKILREASDQLNLLESNKYSDGLRNVCESVEQMLNQFTA